MSMYVSNWPQYKFLDSLIQGPIKTRKIKVMEAPPKDTQRYLADFDTATKKIYIIGGEEIVSPQNVTLDLQIYDPLTATWTIKQGVVPDGGRKQGVAKSIGGGIVALPCRDYLNNIKSRPVIYDPNSDSWMVGSDIITPRINYGGDFYVKVESGEDHYYFHAVLGMDSSGSKTSKNEVYDFTTNTWTAKTDYSRSFYAINAVFDGDDMLHMIGGVDNYWVYNIHDVYDPYTDTYTDTGDPPPVNIGGHSYVCYNDGVIYIIGGWDNSNARLKTNYQYDINGGAWTRNSDMLGNGRAGHWNVVYGNTIFILPGRETENSQTICGRPQAYRINDDTYTYNSINPETGEPITYLTSDPTFDIPLAQGEECIYVVPYHYRLINDQDVWHKFIPVGKTTPEKSLSFIKREDI